jgi:hypothetical protein
VWEKPSVPRVTPDRKAPQVHRERKACKASRVRKVKRERRDHRVRKVLPATRARRATREKKATKAIRADKGDKGDKGTSNVRAVQTDGAVASEGREMLVSVFCPSGGVAAGVKCATGPSVGLCQKK